jgi:hypothetical protein
MARRHALPASVNACREEDLGWQACVLVFEEPDQSGLEPHVTSNLRNMAPNKDPATAPLYFYEQVIQHDKAKYSSHR